MALGDIKTFTINQGGLVLEIDAIDMGGGQTQFVVRCISGSGDINALYWGDGDKTANEGDYFSADGTEVDSFPSSLNMNGTKAVFDGGVMLSAPGLGPEGTAKPSFITANETLNAFTLNVSWASIDDLGVRATSVNGGGSIKGVDTDADVTEAPDISVDNAACVVEGGTSTFTIKLSAIYDYDITINYETVDGTATSGDYTGTTGSVTIKAGDLSAEVTIQTTDDTLDEADHEHFTLKLTSAQVNLDDDADIELSLVIADDNAEGCIIDNDVETPPGGGEPPAGDRIAKSQGFWDTHDGAPNANEWDISSSTSFETYFDVNGPYSGKWDPSAPVNGNSGDLIESPTFSQIMTFKNGSDDKNLLAIEAVTAALNLAEDDLAGVNDSFAEWYIYQRKNFSAADSDADDDLSGYSDAQLLADLRAQVQDAYAGNADAYTVSELAQLLKATHE